MSGGDCVPPQEHAFPKHLHSRPRWGSGAWPRRPRSANGRLPPRPTGCAIEAVVEGRDRVLVVQRTGWGKSVVYFIATRLLRGQGLGPTVLISPLISLMRDQLRMAEGLGVRAAAINHSTEDEWPTIEEALARDEVDLLMITPERFADDHFRLETMPSMPKGIGLFVVDEAHCISDWGHDFRPDYRRIRRITENLGDSVPLLATTATANDRVVEDIEGQLGPDLRVIRGELGRESLLADHRPRPPGPSASPGLRNTWTRWRARGSSTRYVTQWAESPDPRWVESRRARGHGDMGITGRSALLRSLARDALEAGADLVESDIEAACDLKQRAEARVDGAALQLADPVELGPDPRGQSLLGQADLPAQSLDRLPRAAWWVERGLALRRGGMRQGSLPAGVTACWT